MIVYAHTVRICACALISAYTAYRYRIHSMMHMLSTVVEIVTEYKDILGLCA